VKTGARLQPWYRRTGAWIGIGTGPGAMIVGAGMAAEVGPALALPSVLVGCLVLYFVSVAHGRQTVTARAPMGVSVRNVFGDGFRSLPLTVVLVASIVGWCGFYMGLGGAALSDLLGVGQWTGALLLGGTVGALTLAGQDRWNGLLYVTAAAALALTVFTVALVPASPPGRVAHPSLVVGLVAGIGGVISYAIVFTMRVPDFTVDVRGDRDVWLAGLTMLLPLLALTALGVWMYARTGLFHIADVLREVDAPAAGQLFLVASAVAPAVTAAYSGAISIASIRSTPHRPTMLAIAAVAVLLGGERFDLRIIGFLEAVGAVVPPALSVMLLCPRLHIRRGSAHALVAWGVGSITALALRPVSPFAGLAAGSAVAALWLWVVSRPASLGSESLDGVEQRR
jgi:cytosine permease